MDQMKCKKNVDFKGVTQNLVLDKGGENGSEFMNGNLIGYVEVRT